MTAPLQLFRRLYGTSPLHLLAHLAAFAIAVFALTQIINGGIVINFIVWFGGAAVLHDLVAFPLYSGLDRIARVGTGERVSRRVPVINHVRAPALISGVLLLVYFPLILKTADSTYFSATGHHVHGYLRNWLLITAALFLASATIYAVRLRRAAGPEPGEPDLGEPGLGEPAQ
jgi:hypothetical protein